MTWYEYQLKSFAYHRQRKDKWEHSRFVAYHAMISGNVDGSKLPRTLEGFLPLNSGKPSDKIREQFLKEYKEYLDKTKNEF